MATLRTLRTLFTADTSQFERGTKRARNATKRWKRDTDALGATMRRVGSVLLGFFGARILLNATKETIRIADETAKWSARLGVAGEKLQELQFHAEKSGVPINQLRLGLQRMTRRVAEAAQGTGEAQQAIKDLGLSASELVKLTPDQQLRRIADAMQGVENQAQRVRLAFKLFDSEGVALVNTMRDGSKGFDDAARRLRDLGGVITEEQLKKMEDYQNKLTEISAAWTAFKVEIVTGIPETLSGLKQFWSDVGGAAKAALDKMRGGRTPGANEFLPEPRKPFKSRFPQGSLVNFDRFIPGQIGPENALRGVTPSLPDRASIKVKTFTKDVQRVSDVAREAAGSLAGMFDVARIRAEGLSAVLNGVLSQLLSIGSQAVAQHVLSGIFSFVPSPFSVDQARSRP